MKLLLKSLAVLSLMCGVSFAIEPNIVNKSSHTTTNHSGHIPASFLDKILVTAPTTGGSIAVYNSTWTASVLITSATLSNVMTYDFDDTQVRGLWIVTNANANGVTVIYK